MSSKLSKDEFENALQQAIKRRKEVYNNFYALHFRWSNDYTGAERDAHSFSELAKLLGFPEPETYVIPASDPAPGFELQYKISNLLHNALSTSGRSIVLLHYSGHGMPNDWDELIFATRFNGKLKRIAANSFLLTITTDSLIPFDAPVDVVIILDCCYSFLATRDVNPESRMVEILSAGREAADPIAFDTGTRNSFTSKLLQEVRRLAKEGQKIVEMASVIDTLRVTSPVKKPSYAAKVGLGSICLPLVPSALQIDTTSSTDGLLATFSIHVSHDFTDEELKDLVKWLESLPKSKGSTLKLESVKATGSMLFIFESSVLCFYRISGLRATNLICENRPLDFVWLFPGSLAQQ